MQAMLLHSNLSMLRRRDESGGGGMGCFLVLLGIGAVIYFLMKGRRDKAEVLGASKRPMESGSLQAHTFANPYPKCPNCAAAGNGMKQQWDGLRKVTWSCGYCGNTQIQELKDEELPPSARQRLGLDGGQALMAGQQGYQQGGGGMGGVGGLLTGMMLGNMLGGGHHDHRDGDGWGGGSAGSGGDSGSSGGDWGDGGSSSGGDWGDGGGDSGGDSGGGDW